MSKEPKREASDESMRKWTESASAWIADQGERGDWSRRAILDPAVEQILPDVNGMTVLDLGCGEGRYSRILQSKGATVTGIDPVSEFIRHARSRDPESTYLEGIAESIPCEDSCFDLVMSYLSIVDIVDLESASAEISRVLKPNGTVVVVNISNLASTTEGWVKNSRGEKTHRTVDRYMEHFAIDLEWRNIRIKNYHRPLSYVLGLFLDRGFVLKQFVEPLPPESDPHFVHEFRVPTFQIYSLSRLP